MPIDPAAPLFAWDCAPPPTRAPERVSLTVNGVSMAEVQDPGPQTQLIAEVSANLVLRARNYEEKYGVKYGDALNWSVGQNGVDDYLSETVTVKAWLELRTVGTR